MTSDRARTRRGYLAVDALVGLGVATLAVSAAVALAANVAGRTAQARDRLTTVRIAEALYDGLYAGERPDGAQSGMMEGRAWSYVSEVEAVGDTGANVRRARITVARRRGGEIAIDAILPPAPAIASSN